MSDVLLLHDIEARPRISEAPDDIGNAVLQLIQGRKKMSAVTREELVYHVPLIVDRVEKISDREIREAIERLRQTPKGAFICSSSGAQGYWMGSLEEVQACYSEERKRSLTLMARIRKQRDLARRPFQGQLSLFG